MTIVALLLSGAAIAFKRFQNLNSLNSPAILASKYRNLAPFIEAQARHETGNYTSNVYKSLNNPYGMKVPKIRKFLGTPSNIISGGIPYAKYKNLETAHRDFLLWLDFSNAPTEFRNALEYVSFLKSKGYFEDRIQNYYKGVEYFYNEL